jgi:hypothetical protein
MGWPSCADTCSITARVTISSALPGLCGTSVWIGRVGQSWANAAFKAKGKRNRLNRVRRNNSTSHHRPTLARCAPTERKDNNLPAYPKTASGKHLEIHRLTLR